MDDDATRSAEQLFPTQPPMPERIGPYRVLAAIGEGGFGVVYEAEQSEPVRRRVALKVIKPGMDSAAVVARFEAERQALAVMDHPCIAKIHDGGMTGPELGGRPYFVMELVRGVPITEHCDTQQLTIDERCELFIRVCEAVQHAHAKGVVHRDLKPSNVLVAYDAEGNATPKVIDFGVAKALNTRLTAKTIFTERGQLIGTPEYMSPEQAEMSGQDIDTRADVYSLGVLLYELLTGVLPFDPKALRSAAFAEIQRIIRETDPPKPSTRLSTMLGSAGDGGEAADRVKRIVRARKADAKAITGVLKRDLDWVVMRSLEKDRNRRYQTATALGDELRRYLDDEPVEAGPPGVGYRVGKYLRRNKAAAVTATVLLSLLITTTFASSYGYIESNRRRVAAEQARNAEAEHARQLSRVMELQSDLFLDVSLHALATTIGEKIAEEYGAIDPDAEEFQRMFAGVRAVHELNIQQHVHNVIGDALFFRPLRYIDSELAGDEFVQSRLLMSLGFAMATSGLHKDGFEAFRRGVEIYRSESDVPDKLSVDMGLMLVSIANDAEEYTYAAAYLDELQRDAERAYAQNNTVLFEMRCERVLAHAGLGETAEAQKILAKIANELLLSSIVDEHSSERDPLHCFRHFNMLSHRLARIGQAQIMVDALEIFHHDGTTLLDSIDTSTMTTEQKAACRHACMQISYMYERMKRQPEDDSNASPQSTSSLGRDYLDERAKYWLNQARALTVAP